MSTNHRPLRILMLSWRGPFHPNRGGAELYTEEILKRLSARGHEVTWYSGGFKGNDLRHVESIDLIYGSRHILVYLSGHLWLRRNIRQFDVVIDQMNTFGFLAHRVTNRVVVLFHQLADDVWDVEVSWPFNKVGRLMEKLVLRQYRNSAFVTMSQTTVTELKEIGWNGPGYVAATGIDRIATYSKTDFPSLCFLGRFQAKAKRLDHAAHILTEVRKLIPDVRLRVIGRGSPPEDLMNIDGVDFYVDIDDETRDEILGSSWCCVATSVREGWGRMVTEAGAMGTPTVAYDVPGLRDSVINGKTGLLVAEDVSVASDTLIALLKDSELLNKMGQAAQALALNMTWDNSVCNFEDVLQSIVNSDENLETPS